MIEHLQAIFATSIIFIILLSVTALYCMLVSRNLIRILIGLELLIKAVTLLIALTGYLTGRMALAQTFIITLIVIEVVVIAIAAGIVIGAHRHNQSLDVRTLRNLKG
ncbi:MAG: NADH-quinone oxidoreductase subunit K [Verrucomicrobia bacterium]|nr:NADH-quinone oxidoreductase subunit K [Verrucomicrobiota bacterium]MCG2680505.1 NADH-quinone oxidoreductase subunit K [Kiritimatiellia bacterium]MBU4248228.1 NADH-quinone oxidoreductase subunit K [Verrucomicrobiota bacterium]MBU4290431.1 NADH-quinone oxidoreductase subunit K [Verrucomicrobiota bacterium]MBU4430162.1 NADH-quinone oxidoreductase subunit K [Verrucomicrobiota bacterium]